MPRAHSQAWTIPQMCTGCAWDEKARCGAIAEPRYFWNKYERCPARNTDQAQVEKLRALNDQDVKNKISPDSTAKQQPRTLSLVELIAFYEETARSGHKMSARRKKELAGLMNEHGARTMQKEIMIFLDPGNTSRTFPSFVSWFRAQF